MKGEMNDTTESKCKYDAIHIHDFSRSLRTKKFDIFFSLVHLHCLLMDMREGRTEVDITGLVHGDRVLVLSQKQRHTERIGQPVTTLADPDGQRWW